MWVFAGILLGLVVLASLFGFHAGPHAHLVAGALGALAATVLLVMAVEGDASELSWLLLRWRSGAFGRSGSRGLAGFGQTGPDRRPPSGAGSHRSGRGGRERPRPRRHSESARRGLERDSGQRPGQVGDGGAGRGPGGVRLEVWGEELPSGFGRPEPPLRGEPTGTAGDKGVMPGKES